MTPAPRRADAQPDSWTDYERKYRADQAREPAGAPKGTGGEFADEGRGGGGGRTGGGHRLGDLSRKYESGKDGPATVSTGKGDKGGVSYGTWQLATNMGQPAAFLESDGKRWAAEFGTLKPGSPEFSEKWRAIAKRQPAAFEEGNTPTSRASTGSREWT